MVEAIKSIESVIQQILARDSQFEDPGKRLGYGTAGFRANAKFLPRAFFRVGLLVAMRAKSVGRVGVMITASHNHHADNGIKIIEPDGSMLVQDWEAFSEMIVNADDLGSVLQQINVNAFRDLP